jgi:hypothetical protein
MLFGRKVKIDYKNSCGSGADMSGISVGDLDGAAIDDELLSRYDEMSVEDKQTFSAYLDLLLVEKKISQSHQDNRWPQVLE